MHLWQSLAHLPFQGGWANRVSGRNAQERYGVGGPPILGHQEPEDRPRARRFTV